MLLRIWGFDTQAVYNGAAAILAAYDYQPDCIVSDISMPGMSGYQLAEKVRQDDTFQGMTLIAISAYADAGRVKAAGFDHLLVKPADPDAVKAIVKKLCVVEKRLEQDQAMKETTDMMKAVQDDATDKGG